MFRKPWFWILFSLLAAASLLFTVRYFSQGFPIVSIDLRLDRTAALEKALQLAREQRLGPDDPSSAASFGVDSRVQNFVELEAGGAEAFRELIEGDLYSPFTWHIRLFKEGETREASFWFTPSGEPYGFSEKLSEDDPGASLPAEEALGIAESSSREWGLDLTGYQLVEQPQENKPGGRTDHTFVYERSEERVGEGRFRVSLVVSGNRLTEIRHFVKVPEAFERRYNEMRSANDTIAFLALAAVALLYLVGGCAVGLFFLLRKRAVVWKMAVFWGAFIGFLQFLAQLNQLPLAWMDYDTALAASDFLLQQATMALGGAVVMGGVLSISFMAAEGLTRQAFPQQIQLWRLWSPRVANSPTILGQTLTGYLLVPLFFAYEVLLYFFTTESLGWWSPSDALIHPDSLATYFPWITSVAISAQAGFWEESLFRAVPLAGAALLGQRFGRRPYWIGGALILQAIIFGAGHANYPAQPAYARLVELILPALGFGVIYLLFGLLPAVVLHFAFDVCWFAIPVFLSSARGVWVDQLMIVLLTLIPLWAVLLAWVSRRSWVEVAPEFRNQAWEPPEQLEMTAEPAAPVQLEEQLGSRGFPALVVAGAAGLALWLLFGHFSSQAPALDTTRGQALATSRLALESSGVQLDGWSEMASVDVPLNENDRFIWQKGGKEVYSQLMGNYLGAPYWNVRYARFEGDVAERAEEYRVHVDGQNRVLRVSHTLPEGRGGAMMEEPQAREIAERTIREQFGLDPSRLRFVSSEPQQLPDRRDWTFTFADDAPYPLDEGEARITVSVSGDMVSDAYQWVFVPEEWLRAERGSRTVLEILSSVCSALLGLVVFAGAVLAIVAWSRGRFSSGSFVRVLGLLAALSLILAFNRWPSIEAQFSTDQPYRVQLMVGIVALVIVSLLMAAAFALIYGFSRNWALNASSNPFRRASQALTLGAAAVGLLALVGSLGSSVSPYWGDYSAAGTLMPSLTAVMGAVSGLLTRSIALFLLFGLLNRFSSQGTQRRGPVVALILVLSIAVAGSGGPDDYASWLLAGLGYFVVLNLAYWLVFRFSLTEVPLVVAAMSVLDQLQAVVLHTVPAASAGQIAAIVVTLAAAFLWWRVLPGPAAGASSADQPAG